MTDRLFVHHAAGRVGTLEQAADGRFTFSYDSEWLGSKSAFPLSLSLPLGETPRPEAAHAFFSNLLPEGDIRRLLCERLGISISNDFELLAAIGGECAGALVLSREPTAQRRQAEPRYRRLSKADLERLAVGPVLPALDGKAGLRLSLAGAQDKLPVVAEGDTYSVPIGDAPSTHILKFPNRYYKHLPANEVFTMAIARNLGLPVAETRWRPLGRREGVCIVTRFDRIRRGENVIRLHQEDLCQALGRPPSAKYEKEGGPTFQQCFEAVRAASADPLEDGRRMLRWLALNVLVMNADAHAKNVALLYTDAGQIRLAPFYDLVSTRAYPQLSRDLAMSVGGVVEPTEVRREHWERLAEGLKVGSRFVLELVGDVAERLGESVTQVTGQFRADHGDSPALQLIVPKVRRQRTRILKQLA